MKDLIINGHRIQPGESTRMEVNIARLPSHSEINISISVIRALEDGPVVLLSGGLHGDEINGIETVRRLLNSDLFKLKKGAIIYVPIINVFGFINFSREVPDGKDINRSFPGNKTGSLASRVAYFMMKQIIPKIDYGIDYHTGGASRTNYPQIRCVVKDEINFDLAKAFNAPFILNSPFRPNSLRKTASKMGKRILVFEGGESLRMDKFAIQEGVSGTLRLLKYLKMIEKAPEAKAPSILITKSTWVRARFSGLFLNKINSGDVVHKKQILGSITDPFGEFKKTIQSPVNGYIIGLNNNPVVHQGDALMHIALLN